ncbi:ABC transporter substrate-binding protein [Teichococcus vastitatis]|uniref:ABC transporter substrate-binding protein n=1 Tax=Teichococcus vastitatis TaxID=2307076 RepID=A0ABS9WBD4_9PROT|nr:ABC transporter substrate-binding protein [Pseudoroseomonas vastitatis]MCI0756536.1 ABC transporter substrate-binding protein [Pseudoroseomonas vastitatis]
MTSFHRRTLLKAAAGVPLLPALSMPALAQNTAATTLRFIPQANLTALDPVWTTATVTGNHGYYVFDTLYSLDSKGRVQPQMAEGHEVSEDGKTWRIRLRPGLKFHDNEPVRAADCIASVKRWAVRDPFGQLLAKVTEEWRAVDDRTLEIRLNRPFPLLLTALGKDTNCAFIMPERLAQTDATKAITEMVGSGPYRFLPAEFNSGSRVAYAKFDGYVPRQEAPDWATGAKVAHFQRIEWNIITDPATAAGALMNGEVDWWERPLADLQPMLARNKDIRREVLDKAGRMALARLNCLQPPFNDVKVRRAVLCSVIQENYMRASQGDDTAAWTDTRSVWPKHTPYYADNKDLMPGDLDRARAMLKESGYSGQKVAIISPTDFPDIGPLGHVSADALAQIGMNVDLMESDWGTVIQRRNSREPVEKGGWSMFHTTGGATFYGSPAMSPLARGQGEEGWFGWYKSERAEALTEEWLYAPDEPAQKKVAAELGRLALEEVATVPLGQFTIRTAFRSSLTGIIEGTAPYPWGVRRA